MTLTADCVYDFELVTQASGENAFGYGSGTAATVITVTGPEGIMHSHTWPGSDPLQKTAHIRMRPGAHYTISCTADSSSTSANLGRTKASWNWAITGSNMEPYFRIWTCDADFNGDCVLDYFDYLDFVAAWSANDPSADYNSDTSIDFFDYLDFVAAFSAGCE